MLVKQILARSVNIHKRINPSRDESIEFEVRVEGKRVLVVVKDRTGATPLKSERQESRVCVARLKSEFMMWNFWNLQADKRRISGVGCHFSIYELILRR
jgi:hypothetical protein